MRLHNVKPYACITIGLLTLVLTIAAERQASSRLVWGEYTTTEWVKVPYEETVISYYPEKRTFTYTDKELGAPIPQWTTIRNWIPDGKKQNYEKVVVNAQYRGKTHWPKTVSYYVQGEPTGKLTRRRYEYWKTETVNAVYWDRELEGIGPLTFNYYDLVFKGFETEYWSYIDNVLTGTSIRKHPYLDYVWSQETRSFEPVRRELTYEVHNYSKQYVKPGAPMQVANWEVVDKSIQYDGPIFRPVPIHYSYEKELYHWVEYEDPVPQYSRVLKRKQIDLYVNSYGFQYDSLSYETLKKKIGDDQRIEWDYHKTQQVSKTINYWVNVYGSRVVTRYRWEKRIVKKWGWKNLPEFGSPKPTPIVLTPGQLPNFPEGVGLEIQEIARYLLEEAARMEFDGLMRYLESEYLLGEDLFESEFDKDFDLFGENYFPPELPPRWPSPSFPNPPGLPALFEYLQAIVDRLMPEDLSDDPDGKKQAVREAWEEAIDAAEEAEKAKKNGDDTDNSHPATDLPELTIDSTQFGHKAGNHLRKDWNLDPNDPRIGSG
jgi:hypothetical protein